MQVKWTDWWVSYLCEKGGEEAELHSRDEHLATIEVAVKRASIPLSDFVCSIVLLPIGLIRERASVQIG